MNDDDSLLLIDDELEQPSDAESSFDISLNSFK